jgi:hypothetical protein
MLRERRRPPAHAPPPRREPAGFDSSPRVKPHRPTATTRLSVSLELTRKQRRQARWQKRTRAPCGRAGIEPREPRQRSSRPIEVVSLPDSTQRQLPPQNKGPLAGGSVVPHSSRNRPAFVPRTTGRGQEVTGTAGASNPQVRSQIGVSALVATSASRTLSRWRHGFKSRWDYQFCSAIRTM